MTGYREGCLIAKAVKRGIVEQPPGKGKSKRDTPIAVEFRLVAEKGSFDDWAFGKWHKIGRYRSHEIADRVIAKDRLKWQWRKSAPEYRKIDESAPKEQP